MEMSGAGTRRLPLTDAVRPQYWNKLDKKQFEIHVGLTNLRQKHVVIFGRASKETLVVGMVRTPLMCAAQMKLASLLPFVNNVGWEASMLTFAAMLRSQCVAIPYVGVDFTNLNRVVRQR